MTSYLMMFIINITAQVPDSRYYHQLPDFPFVFVSDELVSTPPVISDSLFDAVARGIRFKVNRTELLADDPFIALYKTQLVPWLKSHDMQLRHVYVKGAASPEGPYDNNVRLSRARTQRLIDFLMQELGQPKALHQPVDAQSITEDYALLVKMMQQAGDADYERVNAIWQDCHGDEACCKERLMALDGGSVWDRLLQTYYPALRQSRVVLWFACKHNPYINPMPLADEPSLRLPATIILQSSPAIGGASAADEQPLYKRRHLIAARTNLLHDLLYVPQFGWAYGGNIQLEYYPLRGHYTYNAGFTFTNHRHWEKSKFFQMRDVQLELRRYFKGGGQFLGTYLGLYAQGNKYGIGFSQTKGWEGEGGGAGLTLGHTCRLNKKGSLRLEFSASVGLYITRYDPYIYGNPLSGVKDGLYYYDYYGNTSDFRKRNHQFTWLGPTNAGIHLTYDIIYRKKQPVGAQWKGGQR